MKKSLVALAALAVAGVASAQSSVTLFGIVDAGVSYYQNNGYNGTKTSQTVLSSSALNSSRLGFRGTEDLGGGLAASFWLEAGLGNDNGTAGSTAIVTTPGGAATGAAQLFNRRSTVSLSGGFGELRLGRDYTPTFWNDTIFDPFGTNGVGTSAIFSGANNGGGGLLASALGTNGNNYIRANNTVGYFLPSNLGGFYGQFMYGLPEDTRYDPASATPPGIQFGRYVGGRVGYANGPLDVAVSYGENVLANNFQGGGSAKVDTGNLGASWDFGFMKLMGEYSQIDVKSDVGPFPFTTGVPATTTIVTPGLVDATLRGYLIGATFPVGPGLIRASYSHSDVDNNTVADPKADKFAIGYVHNLSKRTAVYATAAYLKNKDGLSFTNGGTNAPGGTEKSYGYDFGLRHSF